jgi:predicted negative regulator of RcsB-dependent stress response
MDEDTIIINSNTRNEKIRNFFLNNKKRLIIIISVVIILLIGYFVYSEYKKEKRLEISDRYNSVINEYSDENKEITKDALIKLIQSNDSTYSPLSLYFIIDKKLVTDRSVINNLFESIIQDTPLEKEIRNLIIYKKALYNADISEENELLDILKPIINSESIWKSHALYLMAEYFYSKNEKQKSKEFFNKIIELDKSNQDLKIESQKRLNRDLSE